MTALSAINDYLTAVRKRKLTVEVMLAGVLWLASCAWLLLCLVLFGPKIKHWAALFVVVLSTALALFLLLTARVWWTARRLKQMRNVAAFVGGQRPTLRSDLLSAVELATDTTQGFSPSLVDALAEQTTRELNTHKPSRMVSTQVLRQPVALLIAAALAWVVLYVALPQLMTRGFALLRDRRNAATVLMADGRLLGDVVVVLNYPAYMHRTAQKIVGTTGHVLAPLGTKVVIAGALKHTVRSATIAITLDKQQPEKRIALRVSAQNDATTSFIVSGEGHYHVELTELDGRIIRDPIDDRIAVEIDRHPELTFRAPPDNLHVAELQRVELALLATDDWGISRVDLVHQHESGEVHRTTLINGCGKIQSRCHKRASKRYLWKLDELDLKPGSAITYWVEAIDNDAVSGPKTTKSDTHKLVLYSAMQQHEQTLQKQQELLDAQLKILASRLTFFETVGNTPASKKVSPKLTTSSLQKYAALHQETGRLTDRTAKLVQTLRTDALASPAIATTIAKLSKQQIVLLELERKLLAAENNPHKRDTRSSRTGTQFVRINSDWVVALENAALLIADLVDEQHLQMLQTVANRMHHAHHRVSRLLATYEKTHDMRLRDRMRRALDRVQRELNQLIERVARLQTMLPTEYVNSESIAQLNLNSTISQLKNSLDANQIGDAKRALAKLEKALSTLSALLEQNIDHFRHRRLAARERAFNVLFEKLHDIETTQRMLARQTGSVVKAYRKKTSKLLQSKLGPRLIEQVSAQRRVQSGINALRDANLDSAGEEDLERISQWNKWLGEALTRQDIDEALRLAEQIRDDLQRLEEELHDDAIGGYRSWRARQLKGVRIATDTRVAAETIVASINQLIPDSAELLTPPQRKQLRETGTHQAHLRQRLQKMLERPRKPEQRALELLNQAQHEVMLSVVSLMKSAQHALVKWHPHEANGAQRAAADKLKSLRKQLRKGRLSGAPASQLANRQPVALPKPDTFEPPAVFRKDLLEAMKEPIPEQFKTQVQSYYNELAR